MLGYYNEVLGERYLKHGAAPLSGAGSVPAVITLPVARVSNEGCNSAALQKCLVQFKKL